MSSATILERIVPSLDPDATQAIGAALAGAAQAGDLICVRGDLGAGKTQLAKGFGRGLGVDDTVSSPSFVLMAEYEGRLPFFHIDLYRLADAGDALGGGLIDERQAGGVTLIEWPERLGGVLPERRLDITIDGTGDDPRQITVWAAHPALARYLAALDA